jgi:hypothetical protein
MNARIGGMSRQSALQCSTGPDGRTGGKAVGNSKHLILSATKDLLQETLKSAE